MTHQKAKTKIKKPVKSAKNTTNSLFHTKFFENILKLHRILHTGAQMDFFIYVCAYVCKLQNHKFYKDWITNTQS